jgi:hypothetical protein
MEPQRRHFRRRDRLRPPDSVLIVQAEFVVEPSPTPPLPAEAFPLPGAHQVPPNLLFYPVFDKRKAPTRMPIPGGSG